MKHIKPFEDYSINEEGKIASFFKGHASSEDRDRKVVEFTKELDMYEERANTDDSIVFNRAFLEKQAKENNYKGHLEERSSARDGKIHIFYVEGRTPFQNIASTAAGSRNVS